MEPFAWLMEFLFSTSIYSGVHVLLVSLFGRPIVRSISHFFGRPIFFLVDQKPISHFFGRPIFFLVNQKPFSHVFGRPIFFWSTKFIFGQPKKKLVDPKKWEIDRTIGRPRDWPKVHGRRYRQRKFSELAWLRISWYSQNFSSLIKLLFSYS